jgi:hypothetical protein
VEEGMTGDNALKACPFCGSPPQSRDGQIIAYNMPYNSKWPDGRCRVHCSNGFLAGGPCTAEGPLGKSPEEAVRLWNTRSPVEDARGELVEALRPFAAIKPSSLYSDDGSEGEEYLVLLRGDHANQAEFTGKDLARARAALERQNDR